MKKVNKIERGARGLGRMVYFEEGSSQEVDKVDIAESMVSYGGGFISSLGNALYRADYINEGKIIRTWHDDICRELTLHLRSKEGINTDSEL